VNGTCLSFGCFLKKCPVNMSIKGTWAFQVSGKEICYFCYLGRSQNYQYGCSIKTEQ
jgi:hypothetical protein